MNEFEGYPVSPVGADDDLLRGADPEFSTRLEAMRATRRVELHRGMTEDETAAAWFWLEAFEELCHLDIERAESDNPKQRLSDRRLWDLTREYLISARGVIQARRRQLGLEFIRTSIPRETTWKVFDACSYRCVLCGAGPGVPLAVDHIVPISKGGSSKPYNLQALCGPCNSRKRDQLA